MRGAPPHARCPTTPPHTDSHGSRHDHDQGDGCYLRTVPTSQASRTSRAGPTACVPGAAIDRLMKQPVQIAARGSGLQSLKDGIAHIPVCQFLSNEYRLVNCAQTTSCVFLALVSVSDGTLPAKDNVSAIVKTDGGAEFKSGLDETTSAVAHCTAVDALAAPTMHVYDGTVLLNANGCMTARSHAHQLVSVSTNHTPQHVHHLSHTPVVAQSMTGMRMGTRPPSTHTN
jgi:hypothetical protein